MIFHCPHCGLKAVPGKTACTACGRTMTRNCSECREPIAVDARTCKYCGVDSKPLPLPAVPAAVAAPPKKRSCCSFGVKLLTLVLIASLGAAALFVLKARPEFRGAPVKIRQSAPAGSW